MTIKKITKSTSASLELSYTKDNKACILDYPIDNINTLIMNIITIYISINIKQLPRSIFLFIENL